VPGNLDDSLLIDALKFDSFKMPPKGKLPERVIADFEEWVRRGAADPRKESSGLAQNGPKKIDVEAGRRFWCYQPIADPNVPTVRNTKAIPANSVDSFIQAKLDAQKLTPSAEANKTVLGRRLYLDLVGLPPRPGDLDAYLNDDAPDAYEKLVEQLLASPRFGERWGRHWLDVVRYGESLTLRGFVLPEAWRFRDYVVSTFNEDRSFADFIREQVSGDLLSATDMATRRRNLIATTFLTLGNTNLEEQDKAQLVMDVVDEQLDVIGKAFLGQTIGCARCHDHKFDPIPMKDYYALAGILRNSKTLEHSNVSKWLEVPLPVEPSQESGFKKVEQQLASLQGRIKELKDAAKVAASAAATADKATTTVATTTTTPSAVQKSVPDMNSLPGVVIDDTQAKIVGEWKLSKFSRGYVGEGYLTDLNQGKGEKTLTFVPELPHAGKYEVRLAYIHGVSRSEAVPVTIFSADGEKVVHINQKAPPSIDKHFVSLGQYRFEQNGQGFVIVSNEGTTGYVIVDAVQFLPVELLNAPAATTNETASSKKKDKADDNNSKDRVAKDSDKDSAKSDAANVAKASAEDRDREIKALEKELKALTESSGKRPMYMTVKEEAKIDDTFIHVRGSVHNLGEKVPRGFLQVATYGDQPTISHSESGRRELGDWIADANNPLPARVAANRVWHWLFGSGLVRTTDNFGITGETPSHPELLDHLATQLIDSDWSIKSLVREIVLSRTYRQATATDKKNAAADPENRLLWRMNRRRLDAECLLDSVLMVSGDLRLDAGGKLFKNGTTSDYNYKHDTTRRAVYWPTFRNAMPELLEVFDAADPSMVVGKRNTSTVSPQALFMMNDDWIISQAKRAAENTLRAADQTDAERVRDAYRLALGREPSEREQKLALDYVTVPDSPADKKKPNPRTQRWALFFQALFASVDFRYVD
jgi:hypothetical protein